MYKQADKTTVCRKVISVGGGGGGGEGGREEAH